jgi:hypothetical protein
LATDVSYLHAARSENIDSGSTVLIQRRFVLLLLATLMLSGSACAQESGGFAGTWKAEQSDKTYLVITISPGPSLKLSISTAVVRVDKNGEISEVRGPVQHQETVLEPKIDVGVLRFKARQDDGDVVDYEMRLEGDSSALLTLLEHPDVKPFRLRRS